MIEDRVDLSPLDPEHDREHWRDFVDRVALRAAAESAQARVKAEEIELMHWARPSIIAAAIAAAVSSVVLLTPDRSATRATVIGELIGIPSPVAEWTVEGRTPTPAELYVLLARTDR